MPRWPCRPAHPWRGAGEGGGGGKCQALALHQPDAEGQGSGLPVHAGLLQGEAAMSGPDAAGPGAWWAEAAGGGWPQWAWPGAQSSSALPAWGGDGPTSSPGLGIGSTAKKALLDLLGGVRGWSPQAAGDGDPHGAGDQGQPDV